MIQFKKILEYATRPSEGDAFEYLCNLTLQKIDPSSLHPDEMLLDGHDIYFSTLRRSAECLHYNSDSIYHPSDLLREIPFDLRELCSKEEWTQHKSTIVRSRLKDAFIQNTLSLSRERIIADINAFLVTLKENSEDRVSVVSHSFRLKFLQAYIFTRGSLKDKPELINEFIKDDTKTFGWGEGFAINSSDISWV